MSHPPTLEDFLREILLDEEDLLGTFTLKDLTLMVTTWRVITVGIYGFTSRPYRSIVSLTSLDKELHIHMIDGRSDRIEFNENSEARKAHDLILARII